MTHFTSAFIAVFLAAWVLVVGKAIIVPFVIAVFIWYIISALTGFYNRVLPRYFRACLVLSITTFVAIVWLPVKLISFTIPQVIEAAPAYQANLERLIAKMMLWFEIEKLPAIPEVVEKADLGAIVTIVAQGIADVTGYTLLIVIYLIFLLIEQSSFHRKLSAMFPGAKKEARTRRILENISSRIRAYLGIKTLTSLLTAVLSYLPMVFVGLDFAMFWAVLIFILGFIPNIGGVVATLLPALLSLVQFDSLYPFFVIAGSLTALQFIIGNIIEPKLMGTSLNLSPLIILLSLVVWGSIWGIPGMFLCVPITVILMIILSEFPKTRPIAILLSGNGKT